MAILVEVTFKPRKHWFSQLFCAATVTFALPPTFGSLLHFEHMDDDVLSSSTGVSAQTLAGQVPVFRTSPHLWWHKNINMSMYINQLRLFFHSLTTPFLPLLSKMQNKQAHDPRKDILQIPGLHSARQQCEVHFDGEDVRSDYSGEQVTLVARPLGEIAQVKIAMATLLGVVLW